MNCETGDLRRLHPGAVHPTIVSLGELFVLCSDFRDDDGNFVNVDFYLAPKGNSFVVVQSVADDRVKLERLIKIGKAKVAG